MIYLLLALVLDRVQIKLSPTFNSQYCGLGCVDQVNSRTADAPMAYRVLMPWTIALVERLPGWKRAWRYTGVYEPMRILLMALALAATGAALGRPSALALAALLPMTMLFDYWDWAVEVAGFALALTGNVEYALIGGLLAALSRETAPLVPVTYILVSGDIGRGLQVLGGVLAVMLIVRLWAGKKPLYCQRWMWRYNWRDVRRVLSNRPFYASEIFMSLLITALVIGRLLTGNPAPAAPVPLLLLAAGWTMARAAETRVFAPVLLWIVMGV